MTPNINAFKDKLLIIRLTPLDILWIAKKALSLNKGSLRPLIVP